ncbi:hypothetical protein ASPZODRAFT_1970129 [Penicilliopsis zonata CBS 506.65]|uniref:Uncharacterized protein n=1 Tax=Penicilliopsis zonata CBS 506.65 TaxID=1073090 RepID=A0A1L9SHE3_9EURO|nr:hypothetical protein ASPZODRAFT_1970129 [Penicilliopsis zonata CBS 506.65]OJJ46547.1 hypothetical protein ASPZODRAFT_1970129 [Penicilliopsis zonata CBS 506.65]
MATIPSVNTSNALLTPEIVYMVIEHVQVASDLLSCACVNSMWSLPALKKLYRGSLVERQLRTPLIESLDRLLAASRTRFATNTSNIRHLLLSCEYYETPEEIPTGSNWQAVFEECRVICRRKRLASLVIPHEIKHQDFPPISDLLCPTISFLAIHYPYCQQLVQTESINSAQDKYHHLKALNIYKSDLNGDVNALCRLLQFCNLELFLFQSRQSPYDDPFDPTELSKKLLSVLRQHQDLTALALLLPVSGISLIPQKANPWPKLKALSLLELDEFWQEKLPFFEGLEILDIRHIAPLFLDGDTFKPLFENIAQCKHLRSIELVFHELDDVDDLLILAGGCPLLQRLDIRFVFCELVEFEMPVYVLLCLALCLPRLEILHLDFAIGLSTDSFRLLGQFCPRLIMLALPSAVLYLCHEHMAKFAPFQHLEAMFFNKIAFEKLEGHHSEAESIAIEWRRIFPRLQALSYSSETNPFHPNRCVDHSLIYDPFLPLVWERLWKILGYKKDRYIHRNIRQLWQTNLEIELIGWPVMTLDNFSNETWANPRLYTA